MRLADNEIFAVNVGEGHYGNMIGEPLRLIDFLDISEIHILSRRLADACPTIIHFKTGDEGFQFDCRSVWTRDFGRSGDEVIGSSFVGQARSHVDPKDVLEIHERPGGYRGKRYFEIDATHDVLMRAMRCIRDAGVWELDECPSGGE